jgi:hypothetical protein
MNAAGDLLRVGTNAPNAEGNRAIGPYIPPRRRPNGVELATAATEVITKPGTPPPAAPRSRTA